MGWCIMWHIRLAQNYNKSGFPVRIIFGDIIKIELVE